MHAYYAPNFNMQSAGEHTNPPTQRCVFAGCAHEGARTQTLETCKQTPPTAALTRCKHDTLANYIVSEWANFAEAQMLIAFAED
jgi:hypothetical protein